MHAVVYHLEPCIRATCSSFTSFMHIFCEKWIWTRAWDLCIEVTTVHIPVSKRDGIEEIKLTFRPWEPCVHLNAILKQKQSYEMLHITNYFKLHLKFSQFSWRCPSCHDMMVCFYDPMLDITSYPFSTFLAIEVEVIHTYSIHVLHFTCLYR